MRVCVHARVYMYVTYSPYTHMSVIYLREEHFCPGNRFIAEVILPLLLLLPAPPPPYAHVCVHRHLETAGLL